MAHAVTFLRLLAVFWLVIVTGQDVACELPERAGTVRARCDTWQPVETSAPALTCTNVMV
jgi:hypothetical protein